MTLHELWTNASGAICQIVHSRQGVRLSSGSGFMVESGHVVTNNHVIQSHGGTEVSVRFVGADGHTTVAEKSFSVGQFSDRLKDGDPESSWDYAILDLAALPEFSTRPRLTLAPSDGVKVGTPVGLLGFQFDQQNLSIHSGVIASTYVLAGVDYLQLDTSVNSGNSGGPLLDLETGEVIGVVTRKATGLTKQFDQLISNFDSNIKVFEAVQGQVGLAGIDVFKVLTITQAQLRAVATEIRRSANVGIGYAYSLRKIRAGVKMLGGL